MTATVLSRPAPSMPHRACDPSIGVPCLQLDSMYSKNGKYREQLDPYVHRFVEARDVYIKKAESSLDYIR